MYFETVIGLLITTAVLSQVSAQRHFPPNEAQKTPNDLFEESVTRIKDTEFEVDIIVRRPNTGIRQTIGATPNLNRKVDNAKIIFRNSPEEQASESRRQEFEYKNRDFQQEQQDQRRREEESEQEFRRKNGNELEPNQIFNQNREQNIYSVNVSEREVINGDRLQNSENSQKHNSNQQKREGNNRRLCEISK